MRKATLKKGLFALLLALLTLLPAGCWDREEPKNLASVNSILYDRLENGQYRVVLEVMNPVSANGSGGSNGNEKNPYSTACGEGPSTREAINNVSRSLEKTVFSGHSKVRFFTERFAREEMLPLLEVLTRDRLMDETPLMIVIKDETPEDIHFSVVGLSDMVGDYFTGLVKQQMYQTSKSVSVTTLDFIKDYYMQGKQPVMGVAELVEEKSKTTENTGGEDSQEASGSGEGEGGDAPRIILYEGLAAFKDSRLVGYMNGDEARAYNLIVNTVEASFVSIPSGEGQTTIKIAGSKADIKASLEDDQISFQVNIKTTLRIAGESGDLDISRAEPLKVIEARFNALLRSEVEAAIRRAQTEFQSDIFGFGRQMHIQYPERWPELRENWDDHFSSARIEVAVESSVVRTGQIKKPLAMGG